jgi:hypothetical protein
MKQDLEKAICDALGLKHVISLDLHLEHNKPITVEAFMYVELEGIKQLVPVIKKFKLVPVEFDKKQIEDNN